MMVWTLISAVSFVLKIPYSEKLTGIWEHLGTEEGQKALSRPTPTPTAEGGLQGRFVSDAVGTAPRPPCDLSFVSIFSCLISFFF